MAIQLATSAMAGILAHQGGWDEILLIAGPILVIGALLMLAKKRVDAAANGLGNRNTDTGRDTGDHAGHPADRHGTSDGTTTGPDAG